MLGLGGALQCRDQIAAPLLPRFRRFGVDPAQATVDQLDVTDAGDVVLADQIRFEVAYPPVRSAVDPRQALNDGIDCDARRALALVKVIRHQQTLGRCHRGGPLNDGDLRDAPGHVADALFVERINQLLPMTPFQTEDSVEENVNAGGAGFRRG